MYCPSELNEKALNIPSALVTTHRWQHKLNDSFWTKVELRRNYYLKTWNLQCLPSNQQKLKLPCFVLCSGDAQTEGLWCVVYFSAQPSSQQTVFTQETVNNGMKTGWRCLLHSEAVATHEASNHESLSLSLCVCVIHVLEQVYWVQVV